MYQYLIVLFYNSLTLTIVRNYSNTINIPYLAKNFKVLASTSRFIISFSVAMGVLGRKCIRNYLIKSSSRYDTMEFSWSPQDPVSCLELCCAAD